MTRMTQILLSGMAVTVLAATAHANPEADTNKDGVITRVEFMAAAQARFDKTDLDKDGYISQTEREDAREMHQAERRAEHFDRLDLNGDGFISRSEFENEADLREDRRQEAHEQRKDAHKDRLESLKTMADTDGDGVVSEDERAAMREKFEARRGEKRDERRERMAEFRDRHAGSGAGPDGGRRGPDPLSRVDTNSDGLVSAQEYLAGAEKMFEHMDANGDGKLERGEGRRRGSKHGPGRRR